MRVLDLFSGIGGFSLGFEMAGMETVAFCEYDKFCQAVLKKHWPDVKIHDDVRKLEGKEYEGSVDLVCGGYPCQPFSLAGKRVGEEDGRHLWPEMLRIIQGCRPRWVVAENVYGHISLGFDEVAASLETEGFTVWTFIVPASAVGADHRRDRLWIVAHTTGERRGEARQHQSNGSAQRIAIGSQTMANTKRQRLSKSGESKQSIGSEARKNRKAAWLKYGCFNNEWPSESTLGRVADGVPGRVDRLKALGNAVVPKIPFRIGQAILNYEASINDSR